MTQIITNGPDQYDTWAGPISNGLAPNLIGLEPYSIVHWLWLNLGVFT